MEFEAELRNLPISAEFLSFCGIWYCQWWGDDYSIFRSASYGGIKINYAVKDMTVTQTLMGGILNMFSWAYLKYCQSIWQTDRIFQLWLPATSTAYLVFGFMGP